MSVTSDLQQELCQRIGSPFMPPASAQKLGIAIETLGKMPIYGVRVESDDDTCGWYVWAGPHSEDPNFFSPVHAAHIPELCPLILPYLGLAPGYKFIIDGDGYEDVWFEEIP